MQQYETRIIEQDQVIEQQRREIDKNKREPRPLALSASQGQELDQLRQKVAMLERQKEKADSRIEDLLQECRELQQRTSARLESPKKET